ncbi:hypothetical protein HDU81_006706 [Chytriomyces hyalinus]|nr:hypothetical protein HDU81_006706 [Chytriomyces hyalinus]
MSLSYTAEGRSAFKPKKMPVYALDTMLMLAYMRMYDPGRVQATPISATADDKGGRDGPPSLAQCLALTMASISICPELEHLTT